MFTKSIETRGFGYQGASSRLVARRQLEMSVGAVVVIAVLAIGASVSMRSGATAVHDQMATAVTAPIIVKTTARSVPSDRLQANEQTKLGNRI